MTTTETIPIEAVVETYFASWNEADRSRRLELIADSWADAAHYVDPLNDVTGHEGIADMMEGVRAQFPGATLQRTGEIDLHHDVARFPWNATGADGAVIVQGLDVVVVAPDGKLSALAGFFDH